MDSLVLRYKLYANSVVCHNKNADSTFNIKTENPMREREIDKFNP